MSRYLRVSVVCLAVACAAVWASTGTTAQSPSAARPDLSGFWTHPMPPGARGGATVFDLEQMAPFRSGGEALFYEPRTGDPRLDEPRAFCFPSGFPSGMLAPYPVQIVQSGNWLAMVHEFQRMTRLIPLDGRAHRDVEPTYYGDPVGHWEGDALVIETVNFKRWSLDDYYYQNPTQYRMHSEDLRTVERLRFLDPQTISYELTIDDPQIFTEAWTQGFLMHAREEWSEIGLFEFVCQENNRCPGGECAP